MIAFQRHAGQQMPERSRRTRSPRPRISSPQFDDITRYDAWVLSRHALETARQAVIASAEATCRMVYDRYGRN